MSHPMQRDKLDGVLEEIWRERQRQDAKWGEQNHSDELWLAIVTEELGEASKAILEQRFGGGVLDDIRVELLQAAAVMAAWLEAFDRRRIEA